MSQNSADIPNAEDLPENILFFDGVCGLCNQFVDMALKLDRHQRIKFAPIQGEIAQKILTNEQREKLDTVVFWHNQKLLVRSRAVLALGRTLGGWPRLCGMMGAIVPSPIADMVYKVVSRYRYRIWGKKEACRLPTAEEKQAFLP